MVLPAPLFAPLFLVLGFGTLLHPPCQADQTVQGARRADSARENYHVPRFSAGRPTQYWRVSPVSLLSGSGSRSGGTPSTSISQQTKGYCRAPEVLDLGVWDEKAGFSLTSWQWHSGGSPPLDVDSADAWYQSQCSAHYDSFFNDWWDDIANPEQAQDAAEQKKLAGCCQKCTAVPLWDTCKSGLTCQGGYCTGESSWEQAGIIVKSIYIIISSLHHICAIDLFIANVTMSHVMHDYVLVLHVQQFQK